MYFFMSRYNWKNMWKFRKQYVTQIQISIIFVDCQDIIMLQITSRENYFFNLLILYPDLIKEIESEKIKYMSED